MSQTNDCAIPHGGRLAEPVRQDWMILSIKNIKRISKRELKLIKELEEAIKKNTTKSDVQVLLSWIEKEISKFKTTTQNLKQKKLQKDVKNFILERVYPYLQKD